MTPFEEWWDLVLLLLTHPREIKNWTARNSYGLGGQFCAQAYRALDAQAQNAWTNGHPFESPSDWIVCTQLRGANGTKVSKKEFQDRYNRWPAYRDGQILREDFNGNTKASPYLISIFHEFDSLVQPPGRVSSVKMMFDRINANVN